MTRGVPGAPHLIQVALTTLYLISMVFTLFASEMRTEIGTSSVVYVFGPSGKRTMRAVPVGEDPAVVVFAAAVWLMTKPPVPKNLMMGWSDVIPSCALNR